MAPPLPPEPAFSEDAAVVSPDARSEREEQRKVSGLVWRNTLAIAFARITSVVLDGMIYIMTARYFGPVEYGLYLSLLAFLNLVDLAADMTVLDISVREISKDPLRKGLWLGTGSVLRFALAGIGLAAFAAYVYFSHFSGEMRSTAWIAALVLPVSALRMPLALFRASMQMRYELFIVIVTRLMNVILFGALIYFHGHMNQFFLAILISRAALGILAWGAAFRYFSFHLSATWTSIRYLVREALPMGLSGSFVAIQLKADILMIAHMVNAGAAGIYGAVAQLPEYSLYIPVIISTPLLPVLSQAFAESARLRFQVLYQRMLNAIVTVLTPALIVGMLMPRASIAFLFGQRFTDGAAVVPILMLSIASIWVSHATAIAALASGLQINFIWIQSICMIVYLGLDWVLIPRAGVMGAACVRLLTTLMAPVLTYLVVKRRAGFHLAFSPLRPLVWAGIGMAVVVLICSSLPLIAAATLGLMIYGAIFWKTRPAAFVEV